jgi:hypothetical protein
MSLDGAHVQVFDRADGRIDRSIEPQRAPGPAFARIGLYLTWLIRHDLHNPALFQPEHVAAIVAGSMVGSDIEDLVDGTLASNSMSDIGQEFSASCYPVYIERYLELSRHLHLRDLADDRDGYDRVAPILDELFSDWTVSNRMKSDSRSASDEVRAEPSADDRQDENPRISPSGDISRIVTLLSSAFGATVMDPGEPGSMRHAEQELEDLLHALAGAEVQSASVNAAEWGSASLKATLRRLGVQPTDAIVATAIGFSGPKMIVMTAYSIPGVADDRLVEALRTVIVRPPGTQWDPREVRGIHILWAGAGADVAVATIARRGVVLHVAGDESDVTSVLDRLLDSRSP